METTKKIQKCPIIFGEALFDCFEDGKEVLGGAPLNVAWNLKAFGYHPLFISRVGDDSRGHDVLNRLASWGMRTDGVQIDPEHPTGQVSIKQTDISHTFDILDSQAYDYIEYDSCKKVLSTIKDTTPLLYHGSLALRHARVRSTLENIKKDFRLELFLDVNLRAPWWELEVVRRLIAQAKWLKLNEEEVIELYPSVGTDTGPEKLSLQVLREHALELLVLTMDKHGAVIFDADGNAIRETPPNSIEIVDTIGAGDAFSSVVICGILESWSVETMLQRALDFATRVVQLKGATTSDVELYREVRESWNQ